MFQSGLKHALKHASTETCSLKHAIAKSYFRFLLGRRAIYLALVFANFFDLRASQRNLLDFSDFSGRCSSCLLFCTINVHHWEIFFLW
jgi:hypothetical protein